MLAELDNELVALAVSLGGAQPQAIEPVRRSGNSRVYRVRYPDRVLALKSYPPRLRDKRDRLGAETAALQFLSRSSKAPTPRLIAYDVEKNAALMEWIEGNSVIPVEQDAVAATTFLDMLYLLRHEQDARAIPNASEACLSAAEVESQVTSRFAKLSTVGQSTKELSALLDETLTPAFFNWTTRAKEIYQQAGLSWDQSISQEDQILSPSDFGFHNALRRPNGDLVFLDFEYFGWDDPVKLVSDILLHPGMTLTSGMRRHFVSWAFARFESDPSFSARFRALYSLFGLRWCAILLNEFLPEKWAVRSHAGERDMIEAQNRQLAKAAAFAQQLLKHDGICDALCN